MAIGVAQLQIERTMIEQMTDADATREEREMGLVTINRELSDLYSQQLLETGGLRGGMQAFFNDLANQAGLAAQQVYGVFRDAISGINNEIAKAATGQHTSWSKMLTGLSEHLITGGLQQGESALAKLFGQQGGARGGPLSALAGIFGGAAGKR